VRDNLDRLKRGAENVHWSFVSVSFLCVISAPSLSLAIIIWLSLQGGGEWDTIFLFFRLDPPVFHLKKGSLSIRSNRSGDTQTLFILHSSIEAPPNIAFALVMDVSDMDLNVGSVSILLTPGSGSSREGVNHLTHWNEERAIPCKAERRA
jgi:hypothetical protein